MRIGSVEIGAGFPCRIIAEISNAHNGDRDRCGRLIDAAQAAGADVVKFQAYTPDELVALRGDGPAPEPWGSQGYTMRTLYEKAQTPLDWLSSIFDYAKRCGYPMFSSVFGAASLTALEAVGCPAYKISHFETTNAVLGAQIAATGKPIVVSVGQHGVLPVGGLPAFKDVPGERMLFVWCPGAYPAQAMQMQLGSQHFRGLSSHCLDPLVAPLAVARGAQYLEYHFHLEAEPSELEANVSLNEREFRAMVDSVRQAEILLG